jgi:hypothetical protein
MSPSSDPIIEGDLPITKNEITAITLPADPDDGLSDREKDEVVRASFPFPSKSTQANPRLGPKPGLAH